MPLILLLSMLFAAAVTVLAGAAVVIAALDAVVVAFVAAATATANAVGGVVVLNAKIVDIAEWYDGFRGSSSRC